MHHGLYSMARSPLPSAESTDLWEAGMWREEELYQLLSCSMDKAQCNTGNVLYFLNKIHFKTCPPLGKKSALFQ